MGKFSSRDPESQSSIHFSTNEILASNPKPYPWGLRDVFESSRGGKNSRLRTLSPLTLNPRSPTPIAFGPEEANLTTSSVGAAAGDEARSGSLPTIGQVRWVMRFGLTGLTGIVFVALGLCRESRCSSRDQD